MKKTWATLRNAPHVKGYLFPLKKKKMAKLWNSAVVANCFRNRPFSPNGEYGYPLSPFDKVSWICYEEYNFFWRGERNSKTFSRPFAERFLFNQIFKDNSQKFQRTFQNSGSVWEYWPKVNEKETFRLSFSSVLKLTGIYIPFKTFLVHTSPYGRRKENLWNWIR